MSMEKASDLLGKVSLQSTSNLTGQKLMATSNPALDPDQPRGDIEKQRAVWIWIQLESIYPGRWLRTTGDAVDDQGRLNPAAVRWSRRLAAFRREDVLQALDWIPDDSRLKSFLPSLGEMLDFCREAQRLRIARERQRAAAEAVKLEHKARTPDERREANLRGIAACMSALSGGDV